MLLATRWIIAKLRNRQFLSITEVKTHRRALRTDHEGQAVSRAGWRFAFSCVACDSGRLQFAR